MVKEIKGRFVKIDAQDEKLLDAHNWHWINTGTVKPKWYLTTRINKTTVYLHRMIMDAKKGEIVDHKDGKTVDCTRNNLRIVTPSQNRLNAASSANKSVKYKGVFQKKGSKTFYTMIQVTGQPKIYKGGFKTAKKANDWYIDKRKELGL